MDIIKKKKKNSNIRNDIQIKFSILKLVQQSGLSLNIYIYISINKLKYMQRS